MVIWRLFQLLLQSVGLGLAEKDKTLYWSMVCDRRGNCPITSSTVTVQSSSSKWARGDGPLQRNIAMTIQDHIHLQEKKHQLRRQLWQHGKLINKEP